MSVYVDDMYLYSVGRLGRMKMSHMVADTEDELHVMADRIGVDRKWCQRPPRASHLHYDIAMTKRAAAIEAGAIAVEYRELARMMCAKRKDIAAGRPVKLLADYLAALGVPTAPAA